MVEFKALGKYLKMWRARDSGERGVKAHLEGPRNYLEIGENKLVLPSRGEPGIGKEVGRVLENLGKERTVCKKKNGFRLIPSTKHRFSKPSSARELSSAK